MTPTRSKKSFLLLALLPLLAPGCTSFKRFMYEGFGRDDFAGRDKLIRTLSRDRAKDMASDYKKLDPAMDYAARRGIAFKKRVVEIVRKIVPESVRERIDEPGLESEVTSLEHAVGDLHRRAIVVARDRAERLLDAATRGAGKTAD